MFYCQRCANRRQWPQSWSRSHGRCEGCGRTELCYDTPSSALPPVPQPVPRQVLLRAAVLAETGFQLEALTPASYARAIVTRGRAIEHLVLKDLDFRTLCGLRTPELVGYDTGIAPPVCRRCLRVQDSDLRKVSTNGS